MKEIIKKKIRHFIRKNPDKIFKKVKGVIHVGGNTGQEIQLYNRYHLPVIWIEPIPQIFNILESNLKGSPNQIAVKALITDVDDAAYEFHLANNNGASSSIFDLKLHQDIWPEIHYEKTLILKSKTMSGLVRENEIELENYDMLVMDTQGSELLVLKGAIPILHHFNYIKTEAPDFESYKGCCQIDDLDEFLVQKGFKEVLRNRFAKHPNGGSYYDVIYKKV